MRTLVIILIGFLLWGISLFLRSFLNGSAKNATIAFAGVWFFIALFNMWIGITQAGYSVQEELPVFLIVFSPPVILAFLVLHFKRP